MTTTTSIATPHDLLAAVPFLIGYHPDNSLVLIALRGHQLGLAMRVDYPREIDLDQVDSLATHLVREGADGALIVAYVPGSTFDSESLLAPLRDALCLRNIAIRECIEVRDARWRSTICIDHECCPPEGSPLPVISESRLAAEQVLDGRPLPYESNAAFMESIALDTTPDQLTTALGKVRTINYEKAGVHQLQQAGAWAVDRLVSGFAHDGFIRDYDLLALVLVRLDDLTVRDYAMGLVTPENIDSVWALWRAVLKIAPKGFIAPVATLFSAVSYERGDGALATRALDRAFADDLRYPLAVLMRRVYAAGWPAHSFAAMRSELHPKICATLFGEPI
jgi:hypothetical protein